MQNNESLADRLNRLAEQKKLENEAEKQVQRTQDEINQLIFAKARPDFDHLLQVLEKQVSEVNPALQGLPEFQFRKGGPYVRQGNVAAYLSFIQPILNAPPIVLRLSFAREPEGIYADYFGGPPEPERYELQPAMLRGPDRVVWAGDLGEMSSEQLSEFVLKHLTEYF